jgi:hypothetical protein
LQFAKAGSAATLSQQKKNNTEDVQRGRLNTTDLYVSGGKLFLAAMYFRRVRVVGRSFAAAPTTTTGRLERLFTNLEVTRALTKYK